MCVSVSVFTRFVSSLLCRLWHSVFLHVVVICCGGSYGASRQCVAMVRASVVHIEESDGLFNAMRPFIGMQFAK